MPSSITNEQAETVAIPNQKLTSKNRFFSHHKREEKRNDDEKSGPDDNASEIHGPVSKTIAPVSFAELFRYVRLVLCCVCADCSLVASPLDSS